MKDRKFARYVGWFIFAVALITIYKTIDSLGVIFDWIHGIIKILAPFGFAVLLAYLLYFPCRKIERWIRKAKWRFISNRARGLSITIIYILLILAIVLLFKVIFPLLYESIVELAKSLPNYYNKAIELLEQQPEDSILSKIDAVNYVKKLEEINISEMIISFVEFDNISRYIKTITSFAGIIFDIFITLVALELQCELQYHFQ